VGGDLRQGIITLPTIYALKVSSARERLHTIINKPDKSEQEVHEAIELITRCGGINYSAAIANRYIAKAKKELAKLPDVPVKKTMQIIADFIGIRNF
jgi:heptaprenyl diphosphate synthase